MSRRTSSPDHRQASREARQMLMKIDPAAIQWGAIDREAIPAEELDEAREAISIGLDIWAPNVAYDGLNYWLIDGAASLAVAIEFGVKKFPVHVHPAAKEEVARHSERIAKFRAEHADDPDFLATLVDHQRVVIHRPRGSRRKGEPILVEEHETLTPMDLPGPMTGPSSISAETASIPPEQPPATRSFSDQLRELIRRDGRTVYAIETAAGLPRGGVGRFLAGQRGLTTDTLDRLAVVIGLQLPQA